MKVQNLCGQWMMECPGGRIIEGTVPGSVYSFLLNAGEMEDPFYRDNELSALKLMEEDYTFRRTFTADEGLTKMSCQVLRFDGVDTLSEIFLNGVLLGETDNMHRYWEFDVRGILKDGENCLEVFLKSPLRYIREKDQEYHLGGSDECSRGFPHLRKSHCMFGWDWGPRLPDEGIWRAVKLLGWEQSRITDIRIGQEHFLEDGTPALGAKGHAEAAKNGNIVVKLTVDVEQSGDLPVSVVVTSPDGEKYVLENHMPFCVPRPKLWWPNGLGEQALYTVEVVLGSAEELCGVQQGCMDTETVVKRIGLRTVPVCRKPDQWGETFAMQANGLNFFSMGADYIPEDSIFSRMTPERTASLLAICKECHFNVIRVWGGGCYPDDAFFDLCDENGFLVWQDMMFACANYRIEDAFVRNITEEIRQNVRRIRHHASLGLWCGNNEMEQFAALKVYDGDEITAADYLIQNEYIIPQILKEEDPGTFYWPSSPSSGGRFVSPQDPDRGDVHYWEVWHGGVPFTAYRAYYFRYLSEFGFQSFPCMKTIKSFTLPVDRNIFSYVMEMHQRNSGANGKIMQYLSATYRYPGDFGTLLYASQLLQAEAIRYGVEHFRRNRNDDRCMGAVYWQLNDIWPVASWASVDYYHRWKALQYYAKRFFAPVMLSCMEESEVSAGRTCISEPAPVVSTATLCVTNETWDTVEDTVVWELRAPQGEVLRRGEAKVTVAPFSSFWLPVLDFSSYDYREVHLFYYLEKNGSSGTVLFCAPKHYRFADPGPVLEVDEKNGLITVEVSAYAKSVEIYDEDGELRLDDNFFDMEPGRRTVHVVEGDLKAGSIRVRTVYDIR